MIEVLAKINNHISIINRGSGFMPYAIVENYDASKREGDQWDFAYGYYEDFTDVCKKIIDLIEPIGYTRLKDICQNAINRLSDDELSDFIDDDFLSEDEILLFGKQKMLKDIYPDYRIISSEDDKMLVQLNKDMEPIEYEMTLSPYVTDEACCRVKINDNYYYF